MKIYTKYKVYNVFSNSDILKLLSNLQNLIDACAKLDGYNTFSESLYFSKGLNVLGDVTIEGDILLYGQNYITHAEDLYTKLDLIHLRENAVLGLGLNEYTGLVAEKYNGETNGLLVFNNKGEARVGDEGDTQPLLTRAEKENLIDGATLIWDASSNRAITRKNTSIGNLESELDIKNSIIELNTAITNEATSRADSDNALQEQIDAKGIIWQSGTAVKAGSLISHEGVIYRAERNITPAENIAEPSSDNADYQVLTDKAFPLVQNKGQRTDVAMSQKAVTDEIADFRSAVDTAAESATLAANSAAVSMESAELAVQKSTEMSEAVNLFVEDIQNRIDNIEIINGDVTNMPDEEDLTEADNRLRLADRAYDPLLYSGKGYRILRRNLTDNTNRLLESMVSLPNTIYEIRYDFDLGGSTIELPTNTTLKFNGGALKNGTLIGNSLEIIGSDNCFDHVNVKDLKRTLRLNVRWFGMSPAATPAKNSQVLYDLLAYDSQRRVIYIPAGEYKMTGVEMPDNISSYVEMFGDGMSSTVLTLDPADAQCRYLLKINASYSHFHDLSLTGAKSNYNWAIGTADNPHVFENTNKNLFALFCIGTFCYSNVIDRVGFNGSPQHGVYLNGINYCVFNDCKFLYNWGMAALNIWTHGAVFKNPWCELNYCGGIVHFNPYGNSRFHDCLKVIGGATENNGYNGRQYNYKGNVKNYVGEPPEYGNSFIQLYGITADFIDTSVCYNGNLTNSPVLSIAPAKYKECVLEADGHLAFVDDRWCDFVVYERNGSMNMTFERDFLAGDKIRIYEFQQDVSITNNHDLSWNFSKHDPSSAKKMLVLGGGYYNKVIFDEQLDSIGAELVGTFNSIIKCDKYNILEDYTCLSSAKIQPSFMGDKSIDNPYFPGESVKKTAVNAFFNPILSITNGVCDGEKVYLYVFAKIVNPTQFSVFGKNAQLTELIKEFPPRRDSPYVIECILNKADLSDYNSLQIRLGGEDNEYYGAFVSSSRCPDIRKYSFTTAPRLLYGYGNEGKMIFYKPSGKPLWWDGRRWVDATGNTQTVVYDDEV